MNGARCNKCGRYVYARKMEGLPDPRKYVCVNCRQENESTMKKILPREQNLNQE